MTGRGQAEVISVSIASAVALTPDRNRTAGPGRGTGRFLGTVALRGEGGGVGTTTPLWRGM